MILYTLNNVRQIFHGKTVLAIDHLEIEAGYIHALLGPNGAGKSTLLDILAFLVPAARGEVTFLGEPVVHGSGLTGAVRRQVVLVDQSPIMFSTTVSKNIEYGLKIRGVSRGERSKIVDHALEVVGLERFKFASAHKLSGGETQRLALARALALEPKVLLCDEPTASVDAEHRNVIMNLLRRINEELGTTIIFTTHDRIQATTLAQRSLALAQGRLAATTHENNFPATLTPQGTDRITCSIHDTVHLTFAAKGHCLTQPEAVQLSLAPEKITFRRPDSDIYAESEVAGTVVMIMAEGDNIRMVVNTGVPIVAVMSKKHYLNYLPQIGENLILVLAEDACTIHPHNPETPAGRWLAAFPRQ